MTDINDRLFLLCLIHLTQDGGDAAVEVSPRDIVYAISADDAAAASKSGNAESGWRTRPLCTVVCCLALRLGSTSVQPCLCLFACILECAFQAALTASFACCAGLKPRVMAQTDLRCGGIAWCDDDLAILFEVRSATCSVSVCSCLKKACM